MNEQAAEEEKTASRRAAAKRRAARQRESRLEAALRGSDCRRRRETTEANIRLVPLVRIRKHVMRNGEGGIVPSYNVQLLTDTTHGLIVNVEATTDAIDYRQVESALQRCQAELGTLPNNW